MADLPSVSVGRSRSIEQTGKIRESLQALKMAQESEMTQINAHFEMSAARQLAVHDKIAAAGRHGIELTTQLVEQHEKVAEEMHTLAGERAKNDRSLKRLADAEARLTARAARHAADDNQFLTANDNGPQITLQACGSGPVKLNIGGYRFEATVRTLTATFEPNYFTALFGGSIPRQTQIDTSGKGVPLLEPRQEDGSFFIDRDSRQFEWVLSYLRNLGNTAGVAETIFNMTPANKALLRAEADFYMLDGLRDLIDVGILTPNRCLTKDDFALKGQEDGARKYLARDPAGAVREHGSLWLLLDVYEYGDKAGPDWEKSAAPRDYPVVFAHCPRKYAPDMAVTPTLGQFKQNMKFISGALAPELMLLRRESPRGLLEGVDWSNLFLAGGAVCAALMPVPEWYTENVDHNSQQFKDRMRTWFRLPKGGEMYFGREKGGTGIPPAAKSGFGQTDLDFFVHGVTTEQAEAKIKTICHQIRLNLKKNPFISARVGYACCGTFVVCYSGAAELDVDERIVSTDVVVVRTQHSVTIVTSPLRPHLQIILRIYSSPAEVLMGFDLDSCAVGYDGSRVFALPRAKRALTKHMNVVDLGRMSQTYEVRLAKYAKRGFAVAIPGFSRAFVNFGIFKQPLKSVFGLAKLLVIEMMDTMKKPLFFEIEAPPPPPPPTGSSGGSLRPPKSEDALAKEKAGLHVYNLLADFRDRTNVVCHTTITTAAHNMLNCDEVDRINDTFLETGRHPSDYCSVFLPQGRGWTAREVYNLLGRRRAWEMIRHRSAQWKSRYQGANIVVAPPRLRTYVYDIITESRPDNSEWGKIRLALPPLGRGLHFVFDATEFADSLAIPAKLEWITADPGRQYVTGSFHPVAENDFNWFAQACSKDDV